MSSRHRSTHRAIAIVSVFVLVLLFVLRPWAPPRVITSNAIDEPNIPEAPTPNEQYPQFADSDIVLSIANLCAAAEQEDFSAAGMPSAEERLAQMADYKESVQGVKQRLIVSPDAEHLHAAALLESDPVERIELITKALAKGRNDAFLIWDAVRICAESLEQTSCPMRAWEDRLLELDGQNSEAWVRVAANRLIAGDGQAALHAMQRAASASETRVYWTESIEMIERGFAAGSDYAFAERASYALGMARSNQPNYLVLYKMCKEQSAKSKDWAYACLAYGELVERQGKTELGQISARAIQKQALELLEHDERLAAVVARQEQVRRNRREAVRIRHRLSEVLKVSIPSIFFGYLAAVRTHGERMAEAHLQKETDRWLSQNKELYCIP